MKVLIVDDSTLIRRSLRKLLEPLTNISDIAEATDAEEGIRLAMEFAPDIVILDIKMPGGSGFGVLREIRKQNSKAAVIVLSKYSSPKLREEMLEEGAKWFFDKSTEFEKVVKIISDYSKRSSS